MYSGWGNTPSRVLGFPIRTSADRHLVDSSPQLFAVTHVLHRFLAPRHPPLALRSLERTKLFAHGASPRARCSCLLCSSQGAIGGASTGAPSPGARARRGAAPAGSPQQGGGCTEGGRFRLLQNGREDKCVVSHEEVRSKPTNLLELGDEPTSAPTGMSRHRVIEDHQRCGMDSLERR